MAGSQGDFQPCWWHQSWMSLKPRQRLRVIQSNLPWIFRFWYCIPPSSLAWREQYMIANTSWIVSYRNKAGDYIPGEDSSLKLICTKVVSVLVNITSQDPVSGPEGVWCGMVCADTTKLWPLPCSSLVTVPGSCHPLNCVQDHLGECWLAWARERVNS